MVSNHSGESTSPPPPARNNRRRGTALSCAECRRLKLKCSRVFPCSNCEKKGVAAICPDGSLTTGKGNRFVLANTTDLHDKITLLASRVRNLEDALATSHSLTSNDRHPLLTDQLLQIKRPLERERLDVVPTKEEPGDGEDIVETLGSLNITETGKTTFFGSIANSLYLLTNENDDKEVDSPSAYEPPMPTSLPWLSHAFPFTSENIEATAEDIRGRLLGYLPPVEDALRRADNYYQQAAWMYTPIQHTDFLDTVINVIYDNSSNETVKAHTISLLYIVLALGTHLDLDAPSHSPQAVQYYHLARAALALEPVFDNASLHALQAMVVMAHYMFWSGIESSRWMIMGLVTKLAFSMGLHRDSGRYQIGDDETHKRRSLFWEIFVYDSWQSLTYGRPPAFPLSHIDAKFPHDATTNAAGEVEMSFPAWKHRFAAECLSVVHDKAYGAKTPSYKVLKELDKKVRTYYVPPSLRVPGFGGAKMNDTNYDYMDSSSAQNKELTMQRYVGFAIREISLFYMHRGFFAQAMEECPNDPMGSKYAESVLAAYNSACTFTALIASLHRQHPILTERMWFLFTHVFSCALVLGSIAIKPTMSLAPSALTHLDAAYTLFTQVSSNSSTVRVLATLQRLRDRANAALSHTTMVPSQTSDNATRMSYVGPSIKKEGDELSPLDGKPLLGSRKGTQSTTGSNSSPSASSPASNNNNDNTSSPVQPKSEQPHEFAHMQRPYTGLVTGWKPAGTPTSREHQHRSASDPQPQSQLQQPRQDVSVNTNFQQQPMFGDQSMQHSSSPQPLSSSSYGYGYPTSSFSQSPVNMMTDGPDPTSPYGNVFSNQSMSPQIPFDPTMNPAYYNMNTEMNVHGQTGFPSQQSWMGPMMMDPSFNSGVFGQGNGEFGSPISSSTGLSPGDGMGLDPNRSWNMFEAQYKQY